MHEGQIIKTRTPEFAEFFERVKVATRLSSQLSNFCLDDGEAIRGAFEELIGKPVGDSFTLIPPFYSDYGLNISVGRAVFIGYQCMFTGHGTIDLADQVMIGPKVNLVTAGHPVEPSKRRDYISAEPITIATNVWIGAAATILPGVTIGPDAVVAAGAVVTRTSRPRLWWRAFRPPFSGNCDVTCVHGLAHLGRTPTAGGLHSGEVIPWPFIRLSKE